MKLAASILAACLALFSPYLLADEIFVAVDGSRQGRFVGEAKIRGLEDKIQAIAFSHEVAAFDVASGRAMSRAQHRQLTITKRVGGASPQFFSALTTGELLKRVTIDVVRPDANGVNALVYQILLDGATVTRIAQRMDIPSPSTNVGYVEDISFIYQRITVSSPVSRRNAMTEWVVK